MVYYVMYMTERDRYAHINSQDPDVYAAVMGEENREHDGIEIIPSENYVSQAVREALASPFTNKYAEGYPGRRYYGGQEFTDAIETIARDRAKQLFNCAFANVQPLSGAPANTAMYFALLEPGDTVLAMDLSHGGHLTHGHPVTYLSKVFRFVRYKMSDITTGEIDFDELRKTAIAEKPKILLAGFSSYPRELDYEKFVSIAREVGALAVADIAHIAGLIAGGAHKNPFDAGFDVMTSTTHKTLRGPRGGLILVRESKDIHKKIASAVFPGLQGGPHMHQIAGKAVAFGEALHPSFKTYTAQIIENARAMAEVFRERNITLITGGTDNHLLLADVSASCGLSGGEAEKLLDDAHITLNKNVIPDDPRKPLDPSGIRFGTPAITTRGFDTADSAKLAEIMCDILTNPTDTHLHARARDQVIELAHNHPIPESFV